MQETEKQDPLREEAQDRKQGDGVLPESGAQDSQQDKKEATASEEAESKTEDAPAEEGELTGEAEQSAGEGVEREGGDEAPILDGAEKRHEKEIAAWKDKYTRLYAEFDNFRKRTEKEKSQMFEMGAKDVIEKLLPVVDNFERALGTVAPDHQEDAFVKGVEGIYKQIQKMFADLDVQPIPAEGEKFDPNLHNAVMTDAESDVPEDTITQDLQKGYTYRGSVVRHSMVKVRKGE